MSVRATRGQRAVAKQAPAMATFSGESQEQISEYTHLLEVLTKAQLWPLLIHPCFHIFVFTNVLPLGF